MDELAMIIISVFIANYDFKTKFILKSFVKALLIVLLSILYFVVKDYINDSFNFESLKRAASSLLLLTIGLFLVFVALEYIFRERN